MKFVIDETVEINAPPETVWNVLTDFPRYGEWNPFCLECRSSLVPGEAIEMTVQLTARPQKVVEWINGHLPGRHFAYNMKPVPLGALTSLRSHGVEAFGAGVTRYHSYFRLSGWMMPLVRALYGTNLKKGFGDMTKAVARRAEQLAKNNQG